ncbi:phage baseplate assembly protein V [Nitratidesulfovibrio liaohensis]|uniref:phage baseplate assembly protein V n=1 Tax=Nitratidesulfovibrio liaohensis TaxID=2604158 RepID=UPI00141DB1C3|nr:phage baseplate assembly protein V [Nitratidesulfovibrio liaohensis]NHZ46299.1 phage baseplate assembly protein V [Nitratidesulfovibrio liaohensis]
MVNEGFASAPPDGMRCVLPPLGGKAAHSVVVAAENGAFRVQALQGGEVCVYNQLGAKITLKKEKIVEVDCDHFRVARESIQMETKQWQATASEGTTFTSPSLDFGGMDGARARATLDADLNTTGDVTSEGDHVAGGISLQHHRHPGDSGGTTGTAVSGEYYLCTLCTYYFCTVSTSPIIDKKCSPL